MGKRYSSIMKAKSTKNHYKQTVFNGLLTHSWPFHTLLNGFWTFSQLLTSYCRLKLSSFIYVLSLFFYLLGGHWLKLLFGIGNCNSNHQIADHITRWYITLIRPINSSNIKNQFSGENMKRKTCNLIKKHKQNICCRRNIVP